MKVTLEVLDEKISHIHTDLTNFKRVYEKDIELVKTQVEKTNGHVAENTKEITRLDKFIWGAVCTGGGVSGTLGIIWTVFTFFSK